jgi:hypothetical protein
MQFAHRHDFGRHSLKRLRAIRQASSPGMQALQTSGLTPYTAHDVATPTSPTRAAQRSPLHRIRPRSLSTKARGIRSRAASSSNENRGHSGEYEQQAPQAWQLSAASSSMKMLTENEVGGTGATSLLPSSGRM